jgi:hypothetical protein
VQQIITTWERSSFSEGARFREILLVAQKLSEPYKEPRNLRCLVSVVKKLPKTLEEAQNITKKLNHYSAEGKVGEVYENDVTVSRLFPQEKLVKERANLFPLIAFQDFKLFDVWNTIIERGHDKMLEFTKYLQQVNGETREGVGAIEGGQYQYLFIMSQESRALKKRDVWVAKTVKDNEIVAEHRFLKETATIPRRAVCGGLRRITGLDRIDVHDDLDFIILKDFPDLPKFLKMFEGKKRDLPFIKKWETHVSGMLTNLAFMRRFNISASGSKLLAFFSVAPMAPLGLMWSIKVPKEDAKILSLWLNSTLNILQVLRDRKETEGAFMQIDEYTLEELAILDPKRLTSKQKEDFLQLFERVKNQRFPSILEQLKTKFPARVEIDRAVLGVLGFGDDEINSILDYLYPALTKEIEQLKTLMQG